MMESIGEGRCKGRQESPSPWGANPLPITFGFDYKGMKAQKDYRSD